MMLKYKYVVTRNLIEGQTGLRVDKEKWIKHFCAILIFFGAPHEVHIVFFEQGYTHGGVAAFEAKLVMGRVMIASRQQHVQIVQGHKTFKVACKFWWWLGKAVVWEERGCSDFLPKHLDQRIHRMRRRVRGGQIVLDPTRKVQNAHFLALAQS